MLSSYYLQLDTGLDSTQDTYHDDAARLINHVADLLANTDTLNELTHSAPRDSCHSDVEVMLEETPRGRELVARCVVDITAKNAVKFDKSKWTKFVKTADYPDMKVTKKQVPRVSDAFLQEKPA